MWIGSCGGHESHFLQRPVGSSSLVRQFPIYGLEWLNGELCTYRPLVRAGCFCAMRLGRPTVWLVLSGPIAFLSPMLWIFLIIAMCYIIPNPQGCL